MPDGMIETARGLRRIDGGYDELLKLTVESVPVKEKRGNEQEPIKGASGKETEGAADTCL